MCNTEVKVPAKEPVSQSRVIAFEAWLCARFQCTLQEAEPTAGALRLTPPTRETWMECLAPGCSTNLKVNKLCWVCACLSLSLHLSKKVCNVGAGEKVSRAATVLRSLPV